MGTMQMPTSSHLLPAVGASLMRAMTAQAT